MSQQQASPAIDRRRPELDGLRGVAAYIVVISHVTNTTGLLGNALGQGGGQLGVMLFFVLSGFLMSTLYLDRPFNVREAARYLAHRFARIVPLYFAVVLAALAIAETSGVLNEVYPVTPYNLPVHLAFFGGVGVFWTVPVEVQFYLVFVVLWAIFARWRQAIYLLAAAAIALSMLFQWTLSPTVAPNLLYCGVFFLAGLVIAKIKWTPAPVAWSIAFVGAWLLLIAIYPQLYRDLFGAYRWATNGDPWKTWRDPLYLIAASAVLVTTINAPLARVVLGNPVMRWAGAISFSVYLLHQPIIELLSRYTNLTASPAVFLMTVVMATAVLGSISYLLWEKPWRSFLNGLGGPKTKQSV